MADTKKKKSSSSPPKKSSGEAQRKKNSKAPATKSKASSRTESTRAARNAVQKEERGDSSVTSQLLPYFMIVAAVFVAVCMFAGDGAGVVGGAIRSLFLGLNGGTAYALPFLIIIPVFTYGRDREEGSFSRKVSSLCAIYLFASVLVQVFLRRVDTLSVAAHWRAGVSLDGGGVIGGIFGELMLRAFGKLGTLVLVFAVLVIPVLFVFNITPRGLWILIRYKLRVARENSEKLAEQRREREDASLRRYSREGASDASRADARAASNSSQAVCKTEENRVSAAEPQRYRVRRRARFNADVPLDDEPRPVQEPAQESKVASETPSHVESESEIDERIFDEVMRRTKARMAAESAGDVKAAPTDALVPETPEPTENENTVDDKVPNVKLEEVKAEQSADDTVDIKKIFVDPEDAELLDRLTQAYLDGDRGGVKTSSADSTDASLTVTRTALEKAEPAEEQTAVGIPEKKKYVFPSTSLITEDTEKRDENIREELHANAVKLVETLKSFNVKTKIDNVSRGPTITRYELLPEAGIRVRSILNLVDDIALNLATTGVRIEAPIPGKAAVGIEVPNKKRATVHLRTLLEDVYFKNAPSKLLCALGEDVGGESVYLDIAKMPHLLIAGATGMGKSVCINSLIVSLLYNASPDEVKLILIDPKKVELNIYNGIPHLLVPVVSDPKKAAGSLSWAVSEMERRFGLIESVGVRDVNNYNKLTADDPAYEYLPYIVIIIDELADLMMTAPNDVEESVCRLMQKARAAGMHVIIGTQRPSVDVITGLIKANIPSRIAFTVASQVDSRTIIDRAGAESLIGRGDMLYLPVGAAKPIRVQGAFVSEADVENVVSFIKSANVESEVEYSSDVIEQIEKEAAKCGTGKKGSSASGDVAEADDDPMLKSALELAVNSGKISTSLIQRRLSLGYGRAAKLIDRMEQLGYVSPPEGQKPREVLITKEQYMEMVLKREDELL